MSTPKIALSPVPTRRTLEITFAAVVALSAVVIFWSQQRYPALLKKYHAGAGVKVAGAISFDALLKVTPDMPAQKRIARTSVNWLYTNRFGMYFALPFGAAMMTLFASTKPKRFGTAAGNVFFGAVAGAPLGVCTNCATPVAQGLLVGGASTRMTLAAMISSPSFNPVVLAMAFVLFPMKLALMRVAAPLIVMLLLPWIVAENEPKAVSFALAMPQEAMGERIAAFVKAYSKNLLRLAVLTLPWMLLAAVIGATVAELVPAYGTHVPVSLAGVVAVAVLGTLLPLPMALDVALAYVLYRSNVPTPYVAALLCTLGPVSVYSLSAMGRELGAKTSVKLAGVVALLGVAAGVVAMVS
ncbi:MAG: permease [Acidobacteriales bacterium]|nr:permease [Terriglobales bacterium]